jgi:Flp pilus assembly protein TadD
MSPAQETRSAHGDPCATVELESRASVRSRALAFAVIVVSTVLVYSNTFDASFHFDDIPHIVLNRTLRDLRSLWPPSGTRYLGYLSFALNYRLGGLAVSGFHVANLVIHSCNALLVFWLAELTLRTPALRDAEASPLVRRFLPLTAGLLFAVHPVQTQSVTYIVQRFACLATLFFLLSLALYTRARLTLEQERHLTLRAALPYGLSVVAAVAAMKTKEISFTLPVVALAYELLFFRAGRWRWLLVPLAATAVLVPLGVASQGGAIGDDPGELGGLLAQTSAITRRAYLLTESRVLMTYVRLLLVPVQQNFDYDFRISRSLADPEVLLSLAGLAAIAVVATLLLRRARRTNHALGVLVFFGVAWFFVTLSVESSVIPIQDVIFEHRLYLPSVGAAVAGGCLLLSVLGRLRLRTSLGLQASLALLLAGVPLGAAAYARNSVWKTELSLWKDVVAKSPGKVRPHFALGLALWEQGQLDDALREYLVARTLDPLRADTRLNLGRVYRATGRVDDAVGEYRAAIELDPGLSAAHHHLGAAYVAKGQLDDAVRELREAIRLDPAVAEVHCALGHAYRVRAQLEDAAREYREAIRLEPGWAMPHANLGEVYHQQGRFDDAVREAREAERLRSSTREPG